MLVVGRAKSSIKRRKSLSLFKKNTKPSRLTASPPLYQVSSFLVKTLEEPEAIVAIDDQVVPQPVP